VQRANFARHASKIRKRDRKEIDGGGRGEGEKIRHGSFRATIVIRRGRREITPRRMDRYVDHAATLLRHICSLVERIGRKRERERERGGEEREREREGRAQWRVGRTLRSLPLVATSSPLDVLHIAPASPPVSCTPRLHPSSFNGSFRQPR